MVSSARIDVSATPDRGLLRRSLLTLAIFALIVAGVHAGADHFDDVAFAALQTFDRVADKVLAILIATTGRIFGAGQEWIDATSYRAADLIDLDGKIAAARFLALVLELTGDFMLALPIFDLRGPRASKTQLQDAARNLFADPTVLRFAAPLALIAASLAGVAVVTREMQVLAHDLSTRLELAPNLAGGLAKMAGAGSFLMASIVLASRAVARGLVRADALARGDARTNVPARKRRMRGWMTALIGLPLAMIAFADGALFSVIESLIR